MLSGGVSIQTTSFNSDMVWAFSLKGRPDGREMAEFSPPPAPDNVVKLAGPLVATNTVDFLDYSYAPARVTVKAGTKVTFRNKGTQAHNAAGSSEGGWDTGLVDGGGSVDVVFNKPGAYTFACSPHPFMVGEIVVTGEAVAGPAIIVANAGAPAASHAMEMK